MNLKDIKTKEQAFELLDNWRERADKLLTVYENKSEPSKKRVKAFELWMVLIHKITVIYLYVNEKTRKSQLNRHDYPTGSIFSESKYETIIPLNHENSINRILNRS